MTPTKTKRIFARRRARTPDRCIACGRPIVSVSDTISLQGGAFHAACALYSRRRS
jgi:hypothetical protein